jgi:citronellol/citronellal dehydrogenase
MADAARVILTRAPDACTGNFFIDEEVLREEGVADFSAYNVTQGTTSLESDLFLDPIHP